MPQQSINIVGGGVIGLSIAFEARRRGYDVRIFEKSAFGGQASGAAAGMLAPYAEVEEDPDDFFVLCQDSLRLFPDWKDDIQSVSEQPFEYTASGSLTVFFMKPISWLLKRRWNGKVALVLKQNGGTII
ncbi:FAD-dependent oxidoreductase [Litoribacterium kuwaitense]|uniref:FAD-dependent oxidoreductase n=1 Tax=Litoribacterium kuwaitense TaxID=1398745 RepID=UPI0028A854B7|nr:FAD-dependent oxidoreductase [Litoribacterium kuwaitense]